MSYPHDAVAHNWAHQTGRKHRGFNMYYEGETIFSYGAHFPIARHVTDERGASRVLMTTKSYSVSTAKHKGTVWRAVPDKSVAFDVPDVMAAGEGRHLRNFDSYKERMDAALSKASRARQRKNMHLRDAERMVEQGNAYRHAFKLGRRRKPLALPDDLAAYLNEKRKTETAQRKADERARLKRERDMRDKWLAGDNNWRGYGEHGSALVRLKTHNEAHWKNNNVPTSTHYVETSLGIRVPADEAIKVFRVMKACRARKQGWQRNGETLQAGTWQIDKIDEHGNLRAGCHFITWKAAEPVAQQLGLI
jgi:hypothetical protein